MPEPIATAFVEIRPDLSSFEAETEAGVRKSLSGEELDVRGELKLDGVQEARAQVADLTGSLQEAAAVSLPDTDFSTLAQSADQAVDSVQALAEATSADFTIQGATEAASFADSLATAQAGVNEQVASGETVRRALTATTERAAVAERGLATATATETAAVIQASAEERELFRLRARRAQSLGPLRLAGVGVGAGAAIFAGIQVVRELGDALAVTGNEAATTTGQMRNFGSQILSGNVVGAFKALTNETQTYSTAQLLAINRTEALVEMLKEMGREADLARSAALALQGPVTQVPQFLQTALSREQFQGDTGGQLRVLQQQAAAIKAQIAVARELGADQTELNEALEKLFSLQKQIANESQAVRTEQAEKLLQPFREAVLNAQIEGDADAILEALRRQRVAVERAIQGVQGDVDLRETLLGTLKTTNEQIEAIQDQIVAEEGRHRAEMLDKQLAPFREDVLIAQLGDDEAAQIAGLREQFRIQQRIIDNKRSTQAEREAALAAQVGINSQIEAIENAIASEEQRHADAIEQARNDAHQALLDSLGLTEQRLRTSALRATLDESLENDLKAALALRDFYRQQANNVKLSAAERENYRAALAQQTIEVRALRREEREARQEELNDALTAREQFLRENLELAQLDERTTRDDERRQRQLIQFLRNQARNRDLSAAQRRQFLLKLRRQERELRDLLGQQQQTGQTAQQLIADFLKEEQGFANNLASNFLPREAPRPQLTESTATAPPIIQRREQVRSPFEAEPRTRTTAADEAELLRGQRGTGVTHGQGEALLHTNRAILSVLRDIRSGIGHPEARHTRAAAPHGSVTGVD